MATVITYDGGVIAPQLIDGYEATSEQGNLIHPILGKAAPAVSFRPGKLRMGTLSLIFGGGTAAEDVYAVVDGYLQLVTIGAGDAEELSRAAELAHTTEEVFTLSGDERGTIAMNYVAKNVTRTLDPETRDVWIVSVEYQEVA